MEKKEMRANPIEIQPSMAGTDTNIQHLADNHNGISENVVTETEDAFLAQFVAAPEEPTIKANALNEPPIYGLPRSVQDFIIDVCSKKQVPIEFVLSPLLAVAGTMAGRNAVLDGRGYENSPCFWCMVIGDAGANKSFPQALITKPLDSINRDLIQKNKVELQQWQTVCATLTKNSKGEQPTLPPRPPKCRVEVSDTTREALDEIIAGSPCGVCQVRDELSGWLADIGRYGKSGEIQSYLSYWNGKGATIDRKGETGTTEADRVLFNICGTTQPDVLPDCFPKQYIVNGFAHRFMFFWPQIIPPKKIERYPLKPDTYHWDNLIHNLNAMRQTSTMITLSEDATDIAMQYEQEIESAKALHDITQYEMGALSKLNIYMLRLACVARMLAIANGDSSLEVSAMEMEWATDLCRYLHQTQMRVYEVLTHGRKPKPMTDKELIREIMRRYADKGVTQGKLAKVLGVSQAYISQCVNPKIKPTEVTDETE